MSLKPLHLTLALTGLALAACARGDGGPSRPANEPALVRAAPVTDTLLARPVVATGSVAPQDEIALGFKIGGVIARISVDAGDRVRAGQILASLDLREIDAGLAKARSGAAKAPGGSTPTAWSPWRSSRTPRRATRWRAPTSRPRASTAATP